MPNRASHASPAALPGLLLLLIVAWASAWPAAHAEPGDELALRWPFEPRRDWQVLQGYEGTTHNATAYGGIYRYSFDLILVSDEAGSLYTRTADQPVFAAAEGELVPYFNVAQEPSTTPTASPTVTTPTATATATATSLPPTPTPTPLPSATPTLTATPSLPPSATPTPTLTPTSSPSPTPPPTATPTPTPTPNRRLLGPVVSEEHAPLVLAVAAVGLAGLAWRRLRDWESGRSQGN